MIPTHELVDRLAVFGILMENGEGVLGKSRGYILEKYEATMGLPFDCLTNLLDPVNLTKFRSWLIKRRLRH